MELKPGSILRTFTDHGVEFVLIGGVAAVLHGSPLATFDLDLVPARERQNLDRLSTALTALDAKIRTRPGEPGLAFGHDGRSLGDVTIWNLVTPFGDLDDSMLLHSG